MTIVDADRPYTEPFPCSACGKVVDGVLVPTVHEVKTYHLDLDRNGEVDVSPVVFERLRTLRGLPFRTIPQEDRPRPQVVVIGGPVAHPKTLVQDPKGV